jgi:PilZ domain.
MKGVGSLTIKVEVEVARVQSVRLSIPALAIEQHLVKLFKLNNLPAGMYDGTLTAYLNTGEEFTQAIRLHIEPNQDNVHQFQLSTAQHEVLIRPIDSEGRTVLGAEIRIENVDQNFRTVRDWKGLSYKLKPGEYHARVLLPDLQTKSVNFRVRAGLLNYNLRVQEKLEGTRRERRFAYTIPVDYRTEEGFWVSSQTVNISETGACLLKRPLKIEKNEITVRLFVPAESAPLECPARIRWTRDEESDLPRMGVELFLTTTMKNHLADWLHHHDRESRS